MVSRRQIVAIIVMAIIFSTGGLYIFLNQPPNLSLAEKIILQPGDINISGFRSSSKSQSPLQYANESSNCRAILSNETIDLVLWIEVFNSTNDSRATFFDVIQPLLGERENITLGDEAIYWPQGPGVPSVILLKSNVIAWVQSLSLEVDYVGSMMQQFPLQHFSLKRSTNILQSERKGKSFQPAPKPEPRRIVYTKKK